MDSFQGNGDNEPPSIDDILRSITKSFDQVHLAADFLLLKEDPETSGPDQQLACLIKDRIARIERKVTELYQTLQHPDEKHPFIRH